VGCVMAWMGDSSSWLLPLLRTLLEALFFVLLQCAFPTLHRYELEALKKAVAEGQSRLEVRMGGKEGCHVKSAVA
jgi:hypothetical protein